MKFRHAALLILSFSLPMLGETHWQGTWASAPVSTAPKLSPTMTLGEKDITIREVVHISQGGSTMRISLTNEFGKEPLTISNAHVAFLAAKDRTLPGTDHLLTFAGKNSVTIPAGSFLASDPIKLKLPIFSDLVISLNVPEQSLTSVTEHQSAMATTYLAEGDQTSEEELRAPSTIEQWLFLKNVQVNSEHHGAAIVAFGDSITDGARSKPNTNHRWPDIFATLLVANKKTKHISILNEGIGGNRVLQEGYGPSALDRMERDVLEAPGAKYVVLLEGINDIGRAAFPKQPNDAITAQQLINGYQQIIQRAHAHKLKIFGATLTPYLPAGYSSIEGEKIRQTVNAFIRTPGNFDGVIDFEKAVEDPQNPGHLKPSFDPGDHLHPNDLGYAAMAKAIPTKLFR